MEPFKNRIGPDAVERIATLIPGDWDREGFRGRSLSGLEDLELKDRVGQLADALHAALPDDYPTALSQILAGVGPAPGHTDALTASFELWPLTAFVERHGLDHFDLSLDAMPLLTGHWSCEFAIRPYFRDDPERVLDRLRSWSTHPSAHVRRLVSEGSRPRLPWGIQLAHRIAHPHRMFSILESLRDDPSEYVRRSVANHLNDISKDHPDRLIELGQAWSRDAPAPRTRLIKHALRTLIKAGDPRAFALIGLQRFEGKVSISLSSDGVEVGDSIGLDAEIRSTGTTPQRIRLDYALHHRLKNGTLSPKVFHWTTRTIGPSETIRLRKLHSMRPVTTRRLYPGRQAIDLRINGLPTEALEFDLH